MTFCASRQGCCPSLEWCWRSMRTCAGALLIAAAVAVLADPQLQSTFPVLGLSIWWPSSDCCWCYGMTATIGAQVLAACYMLCTSYNSSLRQRSLQTSSTRCWSIDVHFTRLKACGADLSSPFMKKMAESLSLSRHSPAPACPQESFWSGGSCPGQAAATQYTAVDFFVGAVITAVAR